VSDCLGRVSCCLLVIKLSVSLKQVCGVLGVWGLLRSWSQSSVHPKRMRRCTSAEAVGCSSIYSTTSVLNVVATISRGLSGIWIGHETEQKRSIVPSQPSATVGRLSVGDIIPCLYARHVPRPLCSDPVIRTARGSNPCAPNSFFGTHRLVGIVYSSRRSSTQTSTPILS